jgi:cation diffusion facilitator family transporter
MSAFRIVGIGRGPHEPAAAGDPGGEVRRTRAAAVSIVSNAVLIALKVVAGVVTGSIAIITEAIHSSIDLVASIVAFFSVRKAEEPADESHPYGHEKVENLSAAVEGVLILVGAGVIVYESLRRLLDAAPLESIGFGIAVVAFSGVANLGVSAYLYRRAAAAESPALEGDAAHLRADAFTSFGVVAALVLVELTGIHQLDPATALVVAGAIVVSGLRIVRRSSRVLVDEALPPEELEAIGAAVRSHPAPELAGFHKLRARRAGARRYIDLHVQFRPGTSLERAHQLAHELQGEIGLRLCRADVLIHLEPDAPGSRAAGPHEDGLSGG